jgi:hypothetical protein
MTKRTPKLEAVILAGFAEGHSLRYLCRQFGISRGAFLTWMQSDPDLARRYEEALLPHAEALVDDCMTIAGNPLADLGDGRPVHAGTDETDRLRLGRYRIDARLKIARIYYKRHEAVLARQAREGDRTHLAAAAEQEVDDVAPEANAAESPPAKAVDPDNRPDDASSPVRLATTSTPSAPVHRRVANLR